MAQKEKCMGYIKSFGTKDRAPYYSSNTTGTPAWSGKDAIDFTPEMNQTLREFIYNEAKRQGYNDANQNRVDENKTFCHTGFLDGWPQQLWREQYNAGLKEYITTINKRQIAKTPPQQAVDLDSELKGYLHKALNDQFIAQRLIGKRAIPFCTAPTSKKPTIRSRFKAFLSNGTEVDERLKKMLKLITMQGDSLHNIGNLIAEGSLNSIDKNHIASLIEEIESFSQETPHMLVLKTATESWLDLIELIEKIDS